MPRIHDMVRMGLMVVLLLHKPQPNTAIIAYNCAGANLSMIAVSITNIKPCKEVSVPVNTTVAEFQLLEKASTMNLRVKSCLVTVFRSITHCGMHSHSSSVSGGVGSYVYTLGRDRCLQAHETGKLTIEINAGKPIVISGLSTSNSVDHFDTFSGSIDNDYNCLGGYFSDLLGSWSSVVAQGQVKVTLSSYETSADTVADIIHLRGSVTCTYSKSTCVDIERGESYWTTVDDDLCHTRTYKVLYTGPANVTAPITSPQHPVQPGSLVSVETADVVFSFRLTGYTTLCHLQTYSTDHPRLILVHKTGATFSHPQRQLTDRDLDLFTYVNSKFVYMEHMTRINFQTLYNYIEKQDCELRYTSMKQQLAMAKTDPQEFAYLFGDGPGFSGTLMGEVIYVTKCIPVEVTLRKTTRCFQELPVVINNQSSFMIPKHHTLISKGTEVTCSSILGPMYRMEDIWWTIAGHAIRTEPPTILDPNNNASWTYVSPQNLATSGIYTLEDLDSLRNHLMYGNERAAISNTITRAYEGLNPDGQGGDFANFLTEEGIEKMGTKVWSKLWSGFSTFGNISAGIIGIISVVQIFKWLVDTLVHAKTLHEVYGWSLTLVCAVWDSLTVFLIHRAHKRNWNDSDRTKIGSQEQLDPSSGNATHPGSGGQAHTQPISTGHGPSSSPMQNTSPASATGYRMHHEQELRAEDTGRSMIPNVYPGLPSAPRLTKSPGTIPAGSGFPVSGR